MRKVVMKFVTLFIMVASVSVIGAQAKEVNTFKIVVESDREDGLYQVGEKATFAISLFKDDKPVIGENVSYTLQCDGREDKHGSVTTADQPVTIETNWTNPGFALIKVTYKSEGDDTILAYAGAGCEPLKIRVGADIPQDFDAFWGAKIKVLNETPLEVTMVPIEVPKTCVGRFECFDIKVNCPGSKTPVSGYLVRPVGAPEKSLPAMVAYHGAGVRSAYKLFVRAKQGMLALDVNAHGIENGRDAEFYAKRKKSDLKGYPYIGSDNRDQSYFQGMFLRAYRAMQFIKSQPEWNGKTLISNGSSQGGGQAIVAAALDPQVSYCIARVSALCDHHGIDAGRQSGWPRFLQKSKYQKKDRDVVSKSIGYYDAAYFASRIKCPITMTAGFIDRTCSPSSVYAAYNSIQGEKSMINNVTSGHTKAKAATITLNRMIKDHIQELKQR